MRAITALVGALALVACAQEAQDEPAVDEAAAEQLAATTFDGGPVAGNYISTSADGLIITQVLRDDGTYTNSQEGAEDVSGSYVVDGDNRICFTDDGSQEARCYLPSNLAEDGTWTATREGDETEIWTVSRSAE